MNILLQALTVILLLFTNACTSTRYMVEGNLKTVQKDNKQIPFNAKYGAFKDGDISAQFTLKSNLLMAHIKNISNNKIRILWDRSAIVDVYGISHGVTFETPQELTTRFSRGPIIVNSTVIAPKSTVFGSILVKDGFRKTRDLISKGTLTKIDSTYYYNPGYNIPGHHYNEGIVKIKHNDEHTSIIKNNNNKTVKLLISVESKNKIKDYNLTFKTHVFKEGDTK